MNERKCKSLMIPIVKNFAKKYDFEAYRAFPSVYYLKREYENYFLRVNHTLGYYDKKNHIGIHDYFIPDLIVRLNHRLGDIILSATNDADYEGFVKFNYEKGYSRIFSEHWYNFSKNKIWDEFHFELQAEDEMKLFTERYEKMIIKYSLPLIEQTKDLAALEKTLKGLKPMDITAKFVTSGIIGNSTAVMVMTILGIEGKDEIINDYITKSENLIEFDERRYISDINRLELYKKTVALLDDKSNIDYILSGLESGNSMISTMIEKKKNTQDEKEDNEDDTYMEPPEGLLDYMIIIDRNVSEKIDDIAFCLKDKKYIRDKKEELYLGELFEGIKHIYIGSTENYTVIALPFEELEVFESEYLTFIEECLSDLFPTSKIFLMHMNKIYSIYYRLISDKKLLSTGLYGIDGTFYIEGELSEEEQQLASKEDQEYDKIAALWHYHFGKMTGIKSPFTKAFGKLKMKEI